MLRIVTVQVTPLAQNCRVVSLAGRDEVLVIDPGGDIDQVIEKAELESAKEVVVLLTHCHWDHVAKLGDLLSWCKGRDLEPLYLAHEIERSFRENIELQAHFFGQQGSLAVPEPTHYVDEETQLAAAPYLVFPALEPKLLFTPGHSPGHLSLFLKQTPWEIINFLQDGREFKTTGDSPVLFSGDALFRGSIGRTDFPGTSQVVLLNSIRTKFFPLPDSTCVLSGHGPDTTLGVEKATNPFLQQINPEISR